MGASKKKNTVKKLAEKLSAYDAAGASEEQEFTDDENVEELFEHYKFVVDKGQSMMRLDKYITSKMTETSRSRVQMAVEAGYVRVNGKIAKSNYKVKPLDEISLVFPYEKRVREIGPENIPIDVVYEDDDLLVINKEAGMVVHPGHGHFSGTLVNAVAYHLGGKNGILVHRIDKDTSGILVIAKNEEAQMKLAKQFFDHTTKRKYVAIVWGNIEEDEGTVDANITRDESDRMRFTVSKDGSKGKHAVTHYRVLERFGYVTVVECILETGRTHQIRVHMKYLGHPLFSDERYGGDKILQGTIFTKYKQFIENCFKILPRQGLHAKTLGFVHPTTGKEMNFDSPVPQDMTALINKMREYTKLRNDKAV
ncbi:MAG: RluA family pseudouridine synthase [Bacteroidales bacterium]|nr:RluA family pseudouridine synthase [Bacteroidales bacterium]